MKIEKMNHIGNMIPPEKRGAAGSGNLDFQKLMDRAGERLRTEVKGIEPAAPPRALDSSLLLSDKGELNVRRAQAVGAVDCVLTLLERYRSELADPGFSLRKIEPSVQTLMKEVEKLNFLKEKLPQNDPLQDIIKAAGIVSGVEIARFNRGDYL